MGTVLLIPVMIISKFASRKDDSDHGNGIGLGMEVPFGPFLGIASIFYFLGLREFVEDWFETSFADFMFSFPDYDPFSVEEMNLSREDMLFLML